LVGQEGESACPCAEISDSPHTGQSSQWQRFGSVSLVVSLTRWSHEATVRFTMREGITVMDGLPNVSSVLPWWTVRKMVLLRTVSHHRLGRLGIGPVPGLTGSGRRVPGKPIKTLRAGFLSVQARLCEAKKYSEKWHQFRERFTNALSGLSSLTRRFPSWMRFGAMSGA
jgi:hypothetical protein